MLAVPSTVDAAPPQNHSELPVCLIDGGGPAGCDNDPSFDDPSPDDP